MDSVIKCVYGLTLVLVYLGKLKLSHPKVTYWLTEFLKSLHYQFYVVPHTKWQVKAIIDVFTIRSCPYKEHISLTLPLYYWSIKYSLAGMSEFTIVIQ